MAKENKLHLPKIPRKLNFTKLLAGILLMLSCTWSHSGGSGEFFVFLGISADGGLMLGRVKNENRPSELFPKCIAPVMTVYAEPSRMHLMWAKMMGREADWSDLAKHRLAMAYLNTLSPGDSLFVSYMGSSMWRLSDCELGVRVWRLEYGWLGEVHRIESYRNY